MAPRKLSDADKSDVIDIYRRPGETTSTIAKQYGVSTSTISRILKTQLPEDEYRDLIAQKRSGQVELVEPAEQTPTVSAPKLVEEKSKPKPVRRARKRSRAVEASEDVATSQSEDAQLLLLADDASDSVAAEPDDAHEPDVEVSAASAPEPVKLSSVPRPRLKTEVVETTDGLDELSDDDLAEEENEDLDDDDDLDDDELEQGDDDFGDEDDGLGEPQLLGGSVEIMPLADAVFPRTCYLVVDRLSELITRPLKEFAELGDISTELAGSQTLPVFDNHRVARRFSRRNQRVIKVPDGQLITKTTTYLQAKGITNLLIDGNIYSLLG